jgi:signal transduction histidine kinase
VDNAIKYSPAGANIAITGRVTDGTATIAVEDNGPGIPPAHRTNLAQRFYRPDRGRDRGRGGFGLGLSLTKAYMALLEGRLDYQPAFPHGSIFILQLPTRPRAVL